MISRYPQSLPTLCHAGMTHQIMDLAIIHPYVICETSICHAAHFFAPPHAHAVHPPVPQSPHLHPTPHRSPHLSLESAPEVRLPATAS